MSRRLSAGNSGSRPIIPKKDIDKSSDVRGRAPPINLRDHVGNYATPALHDAGAGSTREPALTRAYPFKA
jgi:hypothetical protein